MHGTHKPNYKEDAQIVPHESMDKVIGCENSSCERSPEQQQNRSNGGISESDPRRAWSTDTGSKKQSPKRNIRQAPSANLDMYQVPLPLDTARAEELNIQDAAGNSRSDIPSPTQLHQNSELEELGLPPNFLEANESQSSYHGESDASLAQAQQVWKNALSDLAMTLPPATFNTWMKDTQVIGYEDGEFIIGAPNAYACDWIKNRLRTPIKRALAKLQNRSVQVNVRVTPSPVSVDASAENTPLYSTNTGSEQLDDNAPYGNEQANPANTKNGTSQPPQMENGVSENVTQSPNIYSNGALPTNKAAYPPRMNGIVNGSSQPSQQDSFHYGQGMSIELNACHTFDTFVVGNHNRMAHAAAEAISDKPGASFNPLFVYGGVGLGKTHLLHAIGNRAQQKGYRILYCTSEQFTNELIMAIRSQNTENFRNKYRYVDILLIDDIQFIGGKESTQEEFFHTFNHLHAAGKQVILSSDRPPKALPTLEERLRSRFEGGLQTDISKPDFETRVAILQSKAATIGMAVESAALMLIAERVDSNIRELEGALNRIALQAKIFSNRLDVSITESVLKNLVPERTLRTPADIIEIVADYFRLTVEELKSRSRTKDIAHARQVAMYLLREENGMSLPSIGDHLGGRDHSTIRHGVEKVSQDIDNTESVRHQIMALRELIYTASGF